MGYCVWGFNLEMGELTLYPDRRPIRDSFYATGNFKVKRLKNRSTTTLDLK